MHVTRIQNQIWNWILAMEEKGILKVKLYIGFVSVKLEEEELIELQDHMK